MLCRMNCPKPRLNTVNAEHLEVKTEKKPFQSFLGNFRKITSVHFDIGNVSGAC